ncbi:BQ5605_C043g12106 [Microbotryum silenes-dioicae]|uniref:BQ5605_C043g12106 protein n=1 Tax=Microbotryum silenes-dioicae TaxID=796604 RepID=A0A2X0MQN0_9BASI|nr:BQ5605_C043g12106 [Microbotryum silenes-dioicae]
MSPVQTEAQASPSFSLLLFTPCPSHLIPSPPRARDIRSGRCGSSATNTGYRNGCRMQHSYEFDGRIESIDFVRLRIRVIGTLNASGSVNCGSPCRGYSPLKLATPVKRSTVLAGRTVEEARARKSPSQAFARSNVQERSSRTPESPAGGAFFFFDILRTQNPENRRGALQKIDLLGRNTRFAPEAHVQILTFSPYGMALGPFAFASKRASRCSRLNKSLAIFGNHFSSVAHDEMIPCLFLDEDQDYYLNDDEFDRLSPLTNMTVKLPSSSPSMSLPPTPQRYPHFGSLDGAVTAATPLGIGSLICFGLKCGMHSLSCDQTVYGEETLSIGIGTDNKPQQPRHARRLVGSTLKCRRTGASPHQENMLFHTPH